MIVKMYKANILCLDSDRDATLDILRNLGVLHLTHTRTPEGADLENTREALAHARRALDFLPAKPQPKTIAGKQKPSETINQIWELVRQRKELTDRVEELSHEYRRIAPFGDFDPAAITKLTAQGVIVRLYQISAAQPLPRPEDTVIHILQRDKSNIYFAAVSREATVIDATPLRLPNTSTAALREQLARAEAELTDVNHSIHALAAHRPALMAHIANIAEKASWQEARAGMGAQGQLVYLSGFAPIDRADVLRQAAREHGWGLLLAEPGEDEQVPTLVRNPRWVQPIKTMFDMIGILPGYREVDISVAFLFFLSIFFAMLVGDAGYGLLFLLLTWLARKKFPAAPVYPFRLLQIMSACTVVWGVITGVYFGMQPAGLQLLTIPWLSEDPNLKLLCFCIGAIHLTVAHAWNVVRMLNSLNAIAHVGWILTTWTMFFAARAMVLGHHFPSIMFWALAVGILLIVLFMTPIKRLKHDWFNHVMLPLNLVSNFVDVVSYIRLFAVGAASLAVASSFNKMALSLGLPQPLAGLAGALILFGGHGINILLAAMGVLVHGVRLNTLEFSSHVGIEWSGVQYTPFAKRAMTAGASEETQ